MNDARWERIKAVFEAVLGAPGPEREAALERECGGDSRLRAEVQSLLDTHTQAFVKTGGAAEVMAEATAVAPIRERPGEKIGPYRLLQQIGEGGFGTVFMADQEEPVRRRVALKVIKLGMDTRQVIARFEAERQALALMDHPNIARVLDAGATETGRPYFVMELVKGQAITTFCDQGRLSIPDRLELFAQVCQAVQHAHTKGIIHRDIKPSNVLVSVQDGKPFAKVIDFGIAKATQSKLTERTLFTEHQQLIGTPEYMSPEQAQGSLDIDTRTDVYSLGVLLYELLTGATPFSGTELRSAAYDEIRRIIREVEPPAPSTRLSQSLDTAAAVAAMRQTEPRKLGLTLRGELDWIVMKALEKDRSRRYESASGLVSDLRRYLAGEPVHAAPPGARYRLRKFVRRHRAGVVLASTITAAVLVGLVGTSAGMVWAVRERDRADAAAIAAHAAQVEAQDRSRDLEKVVSFQAAQLAGVDVMQMGVRFRRDLLEGIRRAGERARAPASKVESDVEVMDGVLAAVDLTGVARSALETGIIGPSLDSIRQQFADQPGVRADLLLSASESARRLGLFEIAERPGLEAVELFTAHTGPTSGKTLNARMRRDLLLKDRGKLEEAEADMRECLALALAEHGPDVQITVDLRANLASVLTTRTQFREAAELYAGALPWLREHMGPTHHETLGCMASLASALSNLERFDEAEPLFREAVDGFRAVYGMTNLRTIQAMNNLAGFYRARKDFARALTVYGEALEAGRAALGQDHWLTLMIIDNIGGVRFAQEDAEGAAEFARSALDGRRRVLGEIHPATLRSCFNLAKVLESQGKNDDAIALYRRAAEGFRGVYGEFHSYTISARTSLAGALLNGARFQECADLLLGEHGLLDAHPEAPKDRRRAVVRALGILYEKWDAAEPGKGHGAESAKWKSTLTTIDSGG